MDHNEFDFMEDLVRPFKEFIKRIDDEKKSPLKHDNSSEEAKLEAEMKVESEKLKNP